MAINNGGPIVAPDEDDAISSTASLSSSILDFCHENGRTYYAYKDRKYYLPNNKHKNNRLDLQHNLFFLTFNNKLSLTPLNLPDSKAIDFGDDYPEAEDFSKPFDYIYSRIMNFSIPNWPEYLKKIYYLRNLTPGGYVEIQEIDVIMKSDDGTLGDDSVIIKWSNLLNEASAKLDIMAEAGFTEIDKKYKELGVWNNENIAIALESLTIALFTRAYGWSVEEVYIFLSSVRKDLNNLKIYRY
ncbi:hypothetical protein QL093DRAFT_2540300 [Fusarium oxysporum]|nr:hypothetical protein QL093DRAFT_2540300 [Fusarium oxysporum]